MQRISYMIYDSRYTTDPDRASVYTVCDSLKEARSDKRTMFTDAVIVKETSEPLPGKTNTWKIIKSEIIP